MSKNIKQIKCNNRTEFIKAQLNFIDDYVGFETGFITNETDMKVLESNKQKLAANYVAAIKEYLTKYN